MFAVNTIPYPAEENKPAVAVRKTASADLGNPYCTKMKKKHHFLRIKPLIVLEVFTKIGQKLFTHKHIVLAKFIY